MTKYGPVISRTAAVGMGVFALGNFISGDMLGGYVDMMIGYLNAYMITVQGGKL